MKTYDERTERAYQKAAEMKVRRKKLKAVLSGAVAVCLCGIIAVNLVLFLPRGSFEISASELHAAKNYTEIINKIRYAKEDFSDDWGDDSVASPNPGDRDTSTPPSDGATPPAPGASGSYEEVTNNQVDGVIEGDLFKRSSTHIFYLYQNTGDAICELQIYSIEKQDSKLVSSVKIPHDDNVRFKSGAEMFLSEDCKTVTLIIPAYNYVNKLHYTIIYSIDVSEVNSPELKNTLCVSGNYISSRLVNGDFLLVTNFTVSYNPDFSDEQQFLPQTGDFSNMQSMPANRIFCPESPTTACYSVICTIKEKSLKIDDCIAFLSYSSTLYVSTNNIFISRNYINTDGEEVIQGTPYCFSQSEISCISYNGKKLNYVNSVKVAGTVLNQYSMDEYEGVLRVATTERFYEPRKYNDYTYYSVNSSLTNASVYCINLDSFKILGSLKRFAPNGEEIRSTRFEKNKAYVCTSIQNTDPVFAIDLSDPRKITYKDTGTIPGYSLSLTKFYSDTLLGIGYDNALNLKIEIYDEGESEVNSVAIYEWETPQKKYISHAIDHSTGEEYDVLSEIYFSHVIFSTDYKSYLIDADSGLIGLCIREFAYYKETRLDDGSSMGFLSLTANYYILLQFDGENINLIQCVEYRDSWINLDSSRSTVIDGYLYILNNLGMTAVEI